MIRQVQPRLRRLSSTIRSVFGIQGAGRLVKYQEAGITHQRPGDLESLSLAAGEVPPLLGYGRPVASPPQKQVAMDRRVHRRLDQAIRC